ncbi:sensor histidine kinase [Actinomadura sp. 9N407]|uniref:sensor histidine kinase n=1 Tax=Actinomadura sp. 9N407 TaxID=3375154 RepID=UPI0037BDF9E0
MDDWGARLDRIPSVGGCLFRAAAGCCAALYLTLCVATVGLNPSGQVEVVLAGLAAVAALMARWLERWALIIGGASLVVTGWAIMTGAPVGGPSVLIEISALLVLIARVVWITPRARLVPLATLCAGAIVVLPLRSSQMAMLLSAAPLAVLVAIAVGTGLYLRAIDARRARALSSARRDERLDLARELHDFVAHHVTGIVVQAQAARFIAGTGAAQDPERLDRMLGDIEAAGTEALTSMRRMVGLLRTAQDGQDGQGALAEDGEAGRRPVGDMSQVRELVGRFTHPPATLTLDPGLGTLPPEVATSVHRVVQEALTNARKHAADATAVHVAVTRLGQGSLEVSVRDDGRGRGHHRLPSGGFGLAGLTERVEAIGGRLTAGPRPEGGWEVVAVVP